MSITALPAAAAQATKAASRNKEHYTREELDALLATCDTRTKSGLRDRCLLLLLWSGGFRITEALALTPGDIDEGGLCYIRHGKGDRERHVQVSAETLRALGAWERLRAKLGASETQPLICQISKGKIGDAVQDSAIRHMLPRRAKKAGIAKRVHAHGFRHSMALNMLADGWNLRDVQDKLGHSSIATTLIYVGHSYAQKDLAMRERQKMAEKEGFDSWEDYIADQAA